MATKTFPLKALGFFFSRILLRRLRSPRSLYRKLSNAHATRNKFHTYPSLTSHGSELSNRGLIFDVEGALLKSSSLFPYFMLVAFEAGGLLRALALLLLYPVICLVGEDMGLKIMVFLSFFGVREESFRVGRAVLPKFFLEEVGLEGFEVVMKFGKKVGVSDLPRVMVEPFLRDYLEVETVVGKELKVVCGYYVGLMEEKKNGGASVLKSVFAEDKMSCDLVGIGSFKKTIFHQLFSQCKENYLVTEADKSNWKYLPKEKYTKPLIFHDGRLATRPTPLATIAMLTWVPFGLFLGLIRALVFLTLPRKIAIPIMVFSGMRITVKISQPSSGLSTTNPHKKTKGVLYVCNHRTLLDPLYLSIALRKPLTAVTYSLSRVSEVLAPIQTVRLTRDREGDAKMMEKLLSEGDLVVCPEGTTCREPYLLRFSPLFAEMSDHIVPVAMDAHVSMFYGTTASGFKCLDPLFFLMNPCPTYKVSILDNVSGSSTCQNDRESGFYVANHVQEKLAKELGFECTRLTRKDKYSILAGNEGLVTPASYKKH